MGGILGAHGKAAPHDTDPEQISERSVPLHLEKCPVDQPQVGKFLDPAQGIAHPHNDSGLPHSQLIQRHQILRRIRTDLRHRLFQVFPQFCTIAPLHDRIGQADKAGHHFFADDMLHLAGGVIRLLRREFQYFAEKIIECRMAQPDHGGAFASRGSQHNRSMGLITDQPFCGEGLKRAGDRRHFHMQFIGNIFRMRVPVVFDDLGNRLQIIFQTA